MKTYVNNMKMKIEQGRVLAVGDIHGNMVALGEALKAAMFDDKVDTLIGLGDYVDGPYPYMKQVVTYLESLGSSFIGLEGNHDSWFKHFLDKVSIEKVWFNQGGRQTLGSFGIPYMEKMSGISTSYDIADFPSNIKSWFDNLKPYLELEIEGLKMLFIHGGIPMTISGKYYDLSTIPLHELNWDREMWETASRTTKYEDLHKHYPNLLDYDKVFIGHTALRAGLPLTYHGITNLDTNAGWYGKVTVMDVVTGEYWQSKETLEETIL